MKENHIVLPTLSKNTIDISPARIRNIIISRNQNWDDCPGRVNIVGVRGMSNRLISDNQFNLYNDSIILISNPEKNNPELGYSLEWYPSSVDPGRISNPNPTGIAHLVNGQYRYKIGTHKNKYPALIQAEKVLVERYFETNRQKVIVDKGWFGINIHRAGKRKYVGNWSAGCQVIMEPFWSSFMAWINDSKRWGQKEFYYTLLDASDLLST